MLICRVLFCAAFKCPPMRNITAVVSACVAGSLVFVCLFTFFFWFFRFFDFFSARDDLSLLVL